MRAHHTQGGHEWCFKFQVSRGKRVERSKLRLHKERRTISLSPVWLAPAQLQGET